MDDFDAGECPPDTLQAVGGFFFQIFEQLVLFLVRDLFKGYEWNRISRSDRLLLGTLFLNYVHTTGTYIEPIEKTSSRQQKYRVNRP